MKIFISLIFSCFLLWATDKPNILIILADDLGYADVGYHGLKEIPTPNIDRIAHEGVQFSAGYSNGSICGPTRAALMSGVYQQRIGCEGICGGRKLNEHVVVGMPLKVKTLAEYFQEAGYATGMFGKWHLGGERLFDKALMPTSRGFDEFFGILEGASLYDDTINRERKYIRQDTVIDYEGEYFTDAIGREAVSFITRRGDKPFFLYLPFTAVHAPMQASEKYMQRFAHIADPNRRVFAGMLSAMDDNIGRVFDALEHQDILDNTLIVFWSDNGGKPDNNYSLNHPLRGQKTQFYEGGIRVPSCIRWPKGKIPAGKTLDQPVFLMDIFPSALEAAQITVPKDIEAKTILPLMQGKTNQTPHPAMFWKRAGKMAVRMGDWKLTNAGGPTELFNLKEDIRESHNIIEKHPDIAKKMMQLWQQWDKDNEPAYFGHDKRLPIEVPLLHRKIGQKAKRLN